MEKSKLYTRTGDQGMTSLVGGSRISKSAPRLEAYGTLDELNSHIGLVAATVPADGELESTLLWIQHRLFDLGSYLATPIDGDFKMPVGVGDDDLKRLEGEIDRIDAGLPRHNRFILPGGCVASANAHIARTVCRRAERRMLSLHEIEPLDPIALRFVNRMSDFLFAVARFCNVNQNIDEIFWDKNC